MPNAISPADPAPAPQAEPLSHSAEPGLPAPAIPPTTAPTIAPDIPPAAPPDAPPALQDSRSLSLAVLAVLGAIFMLHWASAVVVPLVLALTLSYALAPLVSRLQRLHLPRTMAAALVLLAIVAATSWTSYALSEQATQFVESLPAAAQKIRKAARAKRDQPETAIDKVQAAATQLEQAAKEGSKPAPVERGVTRVQIERSQFNVKDYLWNSMPSVATGAGQAMAVLFIMFFLLASGDRFRRKIVKLAGPTIARRKLTLQALDEITDQVQRYLMVQLLISLLVGVATWLAYLAVGVENAAVWGVLAFVLNFIPYIGSVLITGASALAGFVQFGSADMALLLAGLAMLIHIVSGNLLMPWLTSRASRLNPVAVFVGVLFFGWLWGVWGLVLGVPILLMVKAICDRMDELRPVSEMLGD